jgi:hypothetical protein
METKAIDKLINYIVEKYNNLEMDKIDNKSNIRRYTRPIMSNYVENGIAIFMNEILKEKKLNYYIDTQLSVGEKQPLRPDIIVYDDNNVIHAIVEVKSQIGYAGDFTKDAYNKKIEKIKHASNNGKLKISRDDMYFTVSKKCLDFVVVLMSSNSHDNFDNFKDVNSYFLFNDGDPVTWYDNLSRERLNLGKLGINDFVEQLRKIDV